IKYTMKKYLILLVAAITTSVFVSCSDDDFTPPAYVTFEGEELNLSVTQNSSASIDVTVYSNNVSGGDRSFDISVDDASTLGAEAYVLPETVTIPGGSNVGTFTVEVSDNNVDDA